MGPKLLGEGVFGVVWWEMVEFSVFWRFSINLAIVDRVSRAVVVLNDAGEFEMVADDGGDEKTAKFCEISLGRAFVVQIPMFFPFSSSARGCDVATRVGEPISACWDVLMSVCVSTIAGKDEGVAASVAKVGDNEV